MWQAIINPRPNDLENIKNHCLPISAGIKFLELLAVIYALILAQRVATFFKQLIQNDCGEDNTNSLLMQITELSESLAYKNRILVILDSVLIVLFNTFWIVQICRGRARCCCFGRDDHDQDGP